MLDNSQTYIGVLATFIVLCLFNDSENNKEKDNSQSNFILSILFKIGEEKLSLLKNKVEELQQDIYYVFENKGGISSRISELLKKVDSDNDTRNNLLGILKAVRVQGNLFFKEANAVVSYLEEQEKKVQKKEELTYIALLSLILIIVVMFVDCITIFPKEFICKFTSLLILTSSFYSSLLYKKYMKIDQDDILVGKRYIAERFMKPSKKSMIMGMFLTFIGWNIIALFISSKYFYIISLLFVMCLGIWKTKRKWMILCDKYNKYSRVFVLKHGIYIIIYSLICAFFLELMSSFSPILTTGSDWETNLNNWNMNVEFLSNPTIVKYITLIFFTLNGLILPFLLGYLKWNHLEKNAIKELNKLQNKRKENVLEFQKEFQIIERQIETNG